MTFRAGHKTPTPWRKARTGVVFFACDHCGQRGARSPSHCKGDHKFCSSECAHAFQRARRAAAIPKPIAVTDEVV
jgi:hypothetical protein